MGKLIDLTGQRFGFWIVLKKDNKNVHGQTLWLCRCECGVQKSITSNSLRSGNSTSCGCNHSVNLTNKQFGHLLVLDVDYSKGRKYWMCKCDCGNTIIVGSYELKNKIKMSCGKCTQIIDDTNNIYNRYVSVATDINNIISAVRDSGKAINTNVQINKNIQKALELVILKIKLSS